MYSSKTCSETVCSDLPAQERMGTSAIDFISSPHPALPFPSGETSLGTEEAASVEDEHSDPQHCQTDHRTVTLQNQQEWVTCPTMSLTSLPCQMGFGQEEILKDPVVCGDSVLKLLTLEGCSSESSLGLSSCPVLGAWGTLFWSWS